MTPDQYKVELAKGTDLTKEEAEVWLVRLRGYFKGPVLPIERYCSGLRTWQQAVVDRSQRLRDQLFPEYRKDKASYDAYKTEWDAFLLRDARTYKTPRDWALKELASHQEFADKVCTVFMQITKSSMLGRLLYGGEKLRTVACPVHNGTWSGIEGLGDACAHGCELTGWIPE